MFSERFREDVTPNELSIILQDKKSRGETIFDLTESNPTRAGLRYDAKAIQTALASSAAMVYEPDPRGLETARLAISDYYRDLGVAVGSDAIFLTSGTSDAYSYLFKLLADPGDEILVPSPGYPLLAYLAGFENLKAVSYPLRYDDKNGWAIDMEVLRALVTPKCRAIVIVSPNNPTGSFIKAHELAGIDEICLENGLNVIVDEVFADFAATVLPHRVKTAVNGCRAPTFVLNGFSKMLGLPQMKLSWIVVCGNSPSVQASCSRLELLLDFYLSVSIPIQHAAPVLLAGRRQIQQQIRLRTTANSRFLHRAIKGSADCTVRLREGGWYEILATHDPVCTEKRALQLLRDDNTLVHPGYFYGFQQNGFVVVSLLPTEKIFRTGIQRLLSRVNI